MVFVGVVIVTFTMAFMVAFVVIEVRFITTSVVAFGIGFGVVVTFGDAAVAV